MANLHHPTPAGNGPPPDPNRPGPYHELRASPDHRQLALALHLMTVAVTVGRDYLDRHDHGDGDGEQCRYCELERCVEEIRADLRGAMWAMETAVAGIRSVTPVGKGLDPDGSAPSADLAAMAEEAAAIAALYVAEAAGDEPVILNPGE
jgi:hypothetical protein